MANTVVITRKHIIFGICIPLAALLGFLLSEPFDYGTLIFVGILTLLLVTPALIRWHHALLIASCYTQLRPVFLPGQPTLWAILACVSFFFLIVNRSMGHKVDFFRVSYISWTIIALAAVILITSFFTGGIGIGQLGSRNGGGKRYFYALCAILLYFGLSTTTIQRKYVNLAVGFFSFRLARRCWVTSRYSVRRSTSYTACFRSMRLWER